MLNGFLPSTLPCSKTQTQPNSLIQGNVTSYSLDEKADQKPTFSATGFGLELNDGRRYAIDSSKDQFSLERINSYSVSSSSSYAPEMSTGLTLAWLRQIFAETREINLKIIRLLGQSAADNNAETTEWTGLSGDVKAILKNVGQGDWQWGDPVYEGGKIIDVKPKKQYEELFRKLQAKGFKIDGLDILDWLKERSKEVPKHKKETASLLMEPTKWAAEKKAWFDKKFQEDGGENNPLWVFAYSSPAWIAYHCINKSDDELQAIKEDTALEEAPGMPGYITAGDLLKFSQRIDDVVTERQNISAKLQGDINYQNGLYQAFQAAVVNMSTIIAELMKSAFTQMRI